MSHLRAYVIAGAVIYLPLAFAVVGTMDYNDKKAAEQEQKHLDQGRIWSQRCEKKNMDVMATKADKGPWRIHCIPKRTMTADVRDH